MKRSASSFFFEFSDSYRDENDRISLVNYVFFQYTIYYYESDVVDENKLAIFIRQLFRSLTGLHISGHLKTYWESNSLSLGYASYVELSYNYSSTPF